MANNYLQFSVTVDVNPDKVEDLKVLDQWIQDIDDELFESVEEIKFPNSIHDKDTVLFEFCKRQMPYEGCGFNTEFYDSTYYVFADEFGNVDIATEWLYTLIQLEILKPKSGYVVFTWAETWDKPRPGEFAGGAAIISRHGVKFQENPWEWAKKQYREMCYAA